MQCIYGALYYICLQNDFTKDADIYTRPAGRWLNAKARCTYVLDILLSQNAHAQYI